MIPSEARLPFVPHWAPAADQRFLRAARLSGSLKPATAPAPDGAGILITGSTGFLGGYLLRALLLQNTSAPIICLVRGDTATERSRLLARVRTLGPVNATERVHTISGDVTQPRLGLSAADFRHLAASVGTIFHLAARLDFRSSFDALRVVNVDAVQQVLSLAAAGIAKRMIYASSLSVLDAPDNYGRVVTEMTPLIDAESLPLGYAQTKWTAERLLAAAGERGFDIIRLRPSWIVGEKRRGLETDFIATLVRVFAAVGATPDTPGALNLVPVSFVAEACALFGMVYTKEVPLDQEVVHLGAPKSVTSAQFAAAIAATGRRMELVPLPDFMSRLSAHLQQTRSLDSIIFRHILVGSPSRPAIGLPYLDGRTPVFDSTASLSFLHKCGLPPPRLDMRGFVRTCLRAG